MPRDGARVVRGPGDRGADERALRQHQGRPRGAAGRGRDLHGRGRRADRQRRLAADRRSSRPRASRSSAARTSRRSRGTGCRRSRRCWSRSPSSTASGASEVTQRTEVLVDALRQAAAAAPSAEPLTESLLLAAVRRLRRAARPGVGRLRRAAPKFPPASALELLLRRGEAELAVPTLDAMAAGGMYDLVGGGFHRYSVDERWLVPHFEKMLYDNALLVPAYLHAWLVTGRERYREVVEETVEYLLRDLRLPGGGFASSQDADTDGVEGLTYSWAPGEGAPEELFEPFEDGRFVLRGALDDATRARLLAIRAERLQPGLDDKAIASWNGLTLAALAEAGRRLGRAEWVDEARALGEFLLGPMSDERGRLYRSVREGRASGAGFLDDYANAAHGLYELHVATGEAALARAGSAARVARGRAVRRRGARWLLPRRRPRASSSSRARRTLRPPAPLGQLDARLRAPAPGADLRRRRARAAALSVCCACSARASAAARRSSRWALNALDLYLATPTGDRDRRAAGERRGASRAEAVRPEHRRRVRPRRGRAAARRARSSSTASRRSTSASASRASGRSPSRTSSSLCARPTRPHRLKVFAWPCSRSST